MSSKCLDNKKQWKTARYYSKVIIITCNLICSSIIVVAFLIIPSDSCTGALESVGRIACDDNALCYQDDGAFTCGCRDTFFGDGWAAGSGCYEGN